MVSDWLKAEDLGARGISLPGICSHCGTDAWYFFGGIDIIGRFDVFAKCSGCKNNLHWSGDKWKETGVKG
jgi:hypothetical protein